MTDPGISSTRPPSNRVTQSAKGRHFGSSFVRPTTLRGRRTVLRPLRISDSRALDGILRDRSVTKFLPPRVRRETGRQFVARALREQRRDGGPSFSVRRIGSDDVIGQIRFVNWSRSERTAEVGYWIRRREWGKGVGTEALVLICRFGFHSMLLQRITANVVAGNTRSQGILEKVGFRREGVSRQAARLAGRWADEHVFGLLRGELRFP
jgi:RimJ/RimL family protein N-acetyltransferase